MTAFVGLRWVGCVGCCGGCGVDPPVEWVDGESAGCTRYVNNTKPKLEIQPKETPKTKEPQIFVQVTEESEMYTYETQLSRL